ncbi:uncharacterized protein LOC132731489 [Ruditapes philippinarum]|uniref:uncharacterized protein LOC132731489 n=1 Tax=Ruditapes philippinarum TaxID=129788 RepID=UPI00295B9C06|nr:uncharacterized protein LOC132731489 [Ruditapes philippinarum]XP_060573662.1 uncharacterized protein LOC132731489 [Ruditapes philippinarum]
MADASKECVMHEVTKDWQDGKNLGQCMLEMFQQGLWTDVVFQCMGHDKGEGVIKAHKNVLASRSSVFQAMFFGPCADTTDVVELKDKEKEILHLFLVYIYSDSITLTEGTASAILEMAHYYQVTNLVQLCSEFLKTVLTASNVCETLTLAMFYNLYGLRDACCSFIDSHAQDVIQTESFMNISEDCLLYILKGDTLYVEEEYILEAVESWARRKLEEKDVAAVSGTDIRKRIGESFYFLRLPTMSSQTLRESVSRKGYFSVEEYADIAAYVNKAAKIPVTTNSCIARVPELETVNINKQDGETIYSKYLHISFEITMLKSAFLSRLVLGEINPYLVNTQEIYINAADKIEHFVGEVRHGDSQPETIRYDFFRKQVVNISTLERPRFRNYYAKEMNKIARFKLPVNLCLFLSGSISVNDIGVEEEFKVQQFNATDTEVNLTKPLFLEKRSAPYIVNISIRYSCSSELELEARCSANKELVTSDTGMIRIQRVSTYDSGIKGIGFKHVSSRDKSNHQPVPETDEENVI